MQGFSASKCRRTDNSSDGYPVNYDKKKVQMIFQTFVPQSMLIDELCITKISNKVWIFETSTDNQYIVPVYLDLNLETASKADFQKP